MSEQETVTHVVTDSAAEDKIRALKKMIQAQVDRERELGRLWEEKRRKARE